jgi:hypothetical protein
LAQLPQPGFSMGAGGGCVAALVVALIRQFGFVALVSVLGRQVNRGKEYVGRPADLLHRQQFAAGHHAGGRELLANSGAEESAENRRIQVAVNASPAAALEVVPAKFLLDLAETGFNVPVIMPPKKNAFIIVGSKFLLVSQQMRESYRFGVISSWG